VTQDFSNTYDGCKVTIGPLEMQIDEAIIAAATEMSGEGEKWFKTTTTKNIEFIPYLKPSFKTSSGRKISQHLILTRNGKNFLNPYRFISPVREGMTE
jgi:hypothetical protein